MDGLSIGEVAERSGVATTAIRYYEQIGLLPAPRRTGGRRRYDAAVLDALAIVRFARHLGFSLTEVRWLLDGRLERPQPERWRELGRRRRAELEALLADAARLQRLLDEALAHRCPRLVERGRALADAADDDPGPAARAAVPRPATRPA